MSVRIYTCGLCMHHHGLYLFTMHTKEHGSLLIQSLERPMKWLTMVESLFFQNRFNSDIGVHGQANFSSFATHHDVHPPPLPMHLFQGVLSKGNMLTYNQVMEVSYKKFQKDQMHQTISLSITS
ncbi:hypothetical protein HN51_037154 [Arachis hypogaea]|uniref:uncharacterized protein LOC107634643 isoform X2 n=1 Tax=Arachis ipaensis TaxID=130454 RepID=UPI0007AFAE3B|nr:uncharacterized protein LOC107634643 isoform X2 [Arachis ipaensis]XP_016193553.1 uncharacterized protein LOC107634643 isoform X2 [Arachis ipaensis]XP_025638117.1 uncharacterized protein LOC112733393 isoform X1 [Arachis hypogaea]